MCKEMPVIPVNRVVDMKRILGKNGGPIRRRGTRGRRPKKPLMLKRGCLLNGELRALFSD
jgi:hypothetical protein